MNYSIQPWSCDRVCINYHLTGGWGRLGIKGGEGGQCVQVMTGVYVCVHTNLDVVSQNPGFLLGIMNNPQEGSRQKSTAFIDYIHCY